MPNKVTSQQQLDRVLELHAAGMSRNDIAREVGIGAATVSKYVHEAGGNFDRTATIAATAARRADQRAARADLKDRLLTKANQLLDEMDAPYLAFNIGGKDNVYTEHPLDQPPPADKLKLMQAASSAIGRHMDLDRHDADDAAAAAKSMLSELGRMLGVTQPHDSA